MLPDRYQSRPQEPTHVEAIRLVEDNLQDAADWRNSYRSPVDSDRRLARVELRQDGGAILLIPAMLGYEVGRPGMVLIHFGYGKFHAVEADHFDKAYEPSPIGNPDMCRCLQSSLHGEADDGEPLRWDPTCMRCGKAVPEALLAEAAETYR